MKKEIMLALNKELEDNITARSCVATSAVLRASFNVKDYDERSSLIFITIVGDFIINEVNNCFLITDVETLNNTLIHRDLLHSLRVYSN